MRHPKYIVKALRVLRRRASLTDCTLKGKEPFQQYAERWIIPIINLIEEGDCGRISRATHLERGTLPPPKEKTDATP